ncbi:MAG: hypothetical protein JST54_22000 [Deltaproteobacteria bacterium]|nr:hypothetical protein [Deltaproteobacteria bacterium]
MKFDYDFCISTSERVAWKLDDVLPKDAQLDFKRRFLPETLVGLDGVDCLSEAEKLKLNQIRGNAYLYLFSFVEEYIIATCVQHVDSEVFGDDSALRAMLRFAEEEVKHQQLFKRACAAFAKSFGSNCEVLPSPEAVAGVILAKSPMAVMLITLHLEVMTQQHYVQCFQDNDQEDLDPHFKQMLKSHWLEEAQHAKLDALRLRKLAQTADAEARKRAITDYLDLLVALDGLLSQQAAFDVASLERATGRTLNEREKKQVLDSQVTTYRRTFITYGITNPTFLEVVHELFPGDDARVSQKAASLL